MTLSRWLIAWRSLRRRIHAVFLATLLILALGIAANTAVFSVVDATLLKPLPYKDPDRLVVVMEGSPKTGREGLLAPGRLEDWNRLSRTFAVISGYYSENVTDTSGLEPERLVGRRVAPRFFQVLETQSALGRYFTVEEEKDTGPQSAVVSFKFWTRRYHPVAVGRGQPPDSCRSGRDGSRRRSGQLRRSHRRRVSSSASKTVPDAHPREGHACFFGRRPIETRRDHCPGARRSDRRPEPPGRPVSSHRSRLDCRRGRLERGTGGKLSPRPVFGARCGGPSIPDRHRQYRRAFFNAGHPPLGRIRHSRRAGRQPLADRVWSVTGIGNRGLGLSRRWIGSGRRHSCAVEIATRGAPASTPKLRWTGARCWSPRWRDAPPGCCAAWFPYFRRLAAPVRRFLHRAARGNSGERHRWQGALAMAQIALTFLLLSGAGLMLRTYENLSTFRSRISNLACGYFSRRRRMGRGPRAHRPIAGGTCSTN